MIKHVLVSMTSALLLSALLPACGAGGAGEGEGEEGEGDDADLDVPPQGEAALDAWIATDRYQQWACEDAPHAPRAPSPHPENRICSNPLLAGVGDGDPIPLGAASVKELFDGSGNLVGHAVSIKVAAGGAGDPAAMYWYEKVDGEAAADGLGDRGGVPQTVCFDCHSHGPDAGGTEQFFTIVR